MLTDAGYSHRPQNEGAFIAVLIDGDGAKFADAYLNDPVEGGSNAAKALRQAVRDHLRTSSNDFNSEDVPILIRVYANINDLAKSLRLSRIIEHDEDMRLFAERFTNSRAEVDFVNVGRGKENADSKLRKMLAHYTRNIQCKKVFVACCHDNGYLHDLRDYSDRADLRQKMVLLETTPAEPGFRMLGLELTRFDTVFRSNGLLNETKRASLADLSMNSRLLAPTQAPPSAYHTLPEASPPRITAPLSAEAHQPHPLPPVQMPTPPSISSSSPALAMANSAGSEALPNRTSSIVTSGNGGMSIRYSTAGGKQDLQNIDIKPAKKKESKSISYNFEGRRIDPPIRYPTNSSAQATYQAKLEKISPNAFCNDHYLIGKCRQSHCKRVHDVELTANEVAIHRYKARTSVCPRGPECVEYDCYLSHHCIKDPRCPRMSACKFAKTDYGNLHLDTNQKLQAV